MIKKGSAHAACDFGWNHFENRHRLHPPNPEYLRDILQKSGAVLVWQDLSKLGKMTSKELDSLSGVLASVIRQKPSMTAGFITAPILAKTGLRDEFRRIEDKMDMKGLVSSLISIRMEIPPSSKRVPLVFYGWVIVDEATQGDNVFMNSQLMLDRQG